jgi:hypothetical protein
MPPQELFCAAGYLKSIHKMCTTAHRLKGPRV